MIPPGDTRLGIAVNDPIRARRLLVAAVAPASFSQRWNFRNKAGTPLGKAEGFLFDSSEKEASRAGDAPAVRAVLRVSRRVELEHGASVTWVGEVDQGVVSDHSCTRGGVKNRLTRCVRSEGFRGAWARKSSRVVPGSPDRNGPRTLSYRSGAPLTRTRASDVDASRRRKGKGVPSIAPVTTTSSSSSSARFAGPAPRTSLFTTTSTTSSSLLPTATSSSSSESVKSTTSTPAISAAPPRVWGSKIRTAQLFKKTFSGGKMTFRCWSLLGTSLACGSTRLNPYEVDELQRRFFKCI